MKIDFKVDRRDLYAPSRGVFTEVVVPPMSYLTVEGSGDPNSSADYVVAVEALFVASYAAKFGSKTELGRDYVVLPLEGQWWAKNMATFRSREKDGWSWRMMIRQPDWIEIDGLTRAMWTAHQKGCAAASKLRPYALDEGRCVQTLHVGSYDDEAPVLAYLHDRYLPDHQLRPDGLHHEIYLSDARRTVPERLRTILRQPVTVADPVH